MRHGRVFQLALLPLSIAVISGSWISLPEKTAIVVEVFDAKGYPGDGVNLLLDGSDTIVTLDDRNYQDPPR